MTAVHALDARERLDPHAHVSDEPTAFLVRLLDDDTRADDRRARVADQLDQPVQRRTHREEVVDDQHLILRL